MTFPNNPPKWNKNIDILKNTHTILLFNLAGSFIWFQEERQFLESMM